MNCTNHTKNFRRGKQFPFVCFVYFVVPKKSPLPFFQIRHGAGHTAVHEQAAFFGARFAHGGDADGRLVGHGAFVLANPAADAQRRVHVGPAQRDGIAVALDDGDFT